jgi:tRNA pseudouridine38-40 synthase
MRTLKLVIQYDGTTYVGWQRQPNGVSIQALVENALAAIEGGRVVVDAASRTDAGVHALGQVASVRLAHPIDRLSLRRALNATLPPDVRVADVQEESPEFHARYAAREKTYRYRILAGEVPSPFERRYVWHVTTPLDVDRMALAIRDLVGRHDFSAFAAAGGAAQSPVRTITSASVAWEPTGQRPFGSGPSPVLAIEVAGDGFLRHMVRTIAGTLVEIGRGRLEPSAIASALSSGDRQAAGPTAPASGLVLVRVVY